MSRSRSSIALALSLVLAGCSKSPSAPTPPAESSAVAPGGASIVAMRVEGPPRVAPGEIATYVALATYSDGSVKDVSATATWNPSSPSSALYFSAPGTAVGVRSGEVTILARIGMTASMPVIVLPKDTFKLSGRVIETSDRPLEGVTIDVVWGIGAGLHAVANPRGEYTLYGVAGPTQLRVSGPGFTPQLRDLVVTADTSSENFVLTPTEAPVPGIAGGWTMTLTPSAACSPAPAGVAEGRRYLVEIKQQGTGLTYTISAPTVTAYNQDFNQGVLFGSHLRLYFAGDTSYGDWSTGNVIDRLSRDEMMQFNGTLDGNLRDTTINATLSGDIVYWDQRRPSFAPNWYCRAKDHSVVLRKEGGA